MNTLLYWAAGCDHTNSLSCGAPEAMLMQKPWTIQNVWKLIPDLRKCSWQNNRNSKSVYLFFSGVFNHISRSSSVYGVHSVAIGLIIPVEYKVHAQLPDNWVNSIYWWRPWDAVESSGKSWLVVLLIIYFVKLHTCKNYCMSVYWHS